MNFVSCMENGKVPIKVIIAIFLLSFLLRLLLIILHPNMPLSTDAIHDYDPIATNLLKGNGFVVGIGRPDSIRGPGYPLFLSAIYYMFGRSFIAVRFVQIIIDSITVVLTFILSWIVFARWDRAFIAGIILAIYPLSIYSSNLIAVENLFAFTFILSIIFFIMAVKADKIVLYFISGAFLSFTTMVRSTTLLFLIIMGTWLFLFVSIRKKYIYYFLFLCFGFIITLAPWTIRNYKVFHEFIPTVANGGNNFYAGSSIRYLIPLDARIPLKKQEIKGYSQEGIQNKEVSSPNELDAHYWRMGWFNYRNTWKDNPLNVLRLLLYKAARFWFATDSGRYQTTAVR